MKKLLKELNQEYRTRTLRVTCLHFPVLILVS